MTDWTRVKHLSAECSCNGCGRRKACEADGAGRARTCGGLRQGVSSLSFECNCYWAPVRDVTRDLADTVEMVRSVLAPLGLHARDCGDLRHIAVTGTGVELVYACKPQEIATAGARTYTATTVIREVLMNRTLIERLIRERTAP